MSATKIRKGEYAYRGYELAVDATGWHIRTPDLNHYPWDGGSTKREAMFCIDQMIEHDEIQKDMKIADDRSTLTDAELIAIDGGWAWLDQKTHIHEEVQS
jgi:hypothetical protein